MVSLRDAPRSVVGHGLTRTVTVTLLLTLTLILTLILTLPLPLTLTQVSEWDVNGKKVRSRPQ